jgi:hypothetical protein
MSGMKSNSRVREQELSILKAHGTTEFSLM